MQRQTDKNTIQPRRQNLINIDETHKIELIKNYMAD